MAAHSAGNRTIPPVAIDQSAVGWPQWLREMAQSINLLSSWVGTTTTPGGAGTVTSVTAGTGLSGSPNPVVGAGTIALTVPVSVANGGTGVTTSAAAPWVEVAGDTMSGSLLVRGGAFPAAPRTLFEMAGTTPSFAISDSSGATDSKTWDITPATNALTFRAVNDTYGAANAFMVAVRSGATIAYTQFPQGGVMVGNPAGGNLGTGNLNAIAVYAMGSLLTSDATLKTDIEPLAAACLPLVMAVAPQTYRWREPEEAEGRRSGFLAQDLAEAGVPGIVAGKPGEGLAIDVGAMLATLWQAVRELTGEVAVLKAAAGEKP